MERSHVPVVLLELAVAAELVWQVASASPAAAGLMHDQPLPADCAGLDALLDVFAASRSTEHRRQLGGMALDLLRPAMPAAVRDLIGCHAAGDAVVVLLAAGDPLASGRQARLLAALRHAPSLHLGATAVQVLGDAVEQLRDRARFERHNHVVACHLEYWPIPSSGRSAEVLERLLQGISHMQPEAVARELAARHAVARCEAPPAHRG